MYFFFVKFIRKYLENLYDCSKVKVNTISFFNWLPTRQLKVGEAGVGWPPLCPWLLFFTKLQQVLFLRAEICPHSIGDNGLSACVPGLLTILRAATHVIGGGSSPSGITTLQNNAEIVHENLLFDRGSRSIIEKFGKCAS